MVFRSVISVLPYQTLYMELKSKVIDLRIDGEKAILSDEVSRSLGVCHGNRVMVSGKTGSATTFIAITSDIVGESEVGLVSDFAEKIGVEEGDVVEIAPTGRPDSANYVRKKIYGDSLSRDEMYELVKDIADRNLSNYELSALVTAVAIRDMSMDEVQWMTEAMVEYGERLEFSEYPVVDKHSIGGVPGNKITLLIVPIVVSAGLLIPKTSSRAITGAAGTADIMEVLAPVKFTAKEIYQMTKEVGGAIVWGGSTHIAPADDEIIRAEYPLSLDPVSILIASVLAKKKAIGADKVVIDIPVGAGTKIEDRKEGSKLARDFIELGDRLDMDIECAVTFGGSPIGKAVGPALEAREALKALEGKEIPKSLIEKSCSIAGILFEMAGTTSRDEGRDKAKKLLESGKPLKKLKEIIEVQGGNPEITSKDIEVGQYQETLTSPSEGYVTSVDNKALVSIARALGSPSDKKAGLEICKKGGDNVCKKDTLIKLYAEEEWKLKEGMKEAKKQFPLGIEGIVLERIPEL
ncbi:AMP phosphorylase [Methanonatronarchaeum sp. AMET-Sl]|uniref:AMP phosphorylase n=1 Tax=Methanonatronarchaeum sp. AMET-Sl TaxID=3037654 RepID=UPI00244DDE1A|nr:AMP phosphorylase [Methanonatronarchaeum sp. AMET-Sl]WGI17819.1 AMP phosphorylase [Methanonatronarchaeum sp. AMET-Sl]